MAHNFEVIVLGDSSHKGRTPSDTHSHFTQDSKAAFQAYRRAVELEPSAQHMALLAAAIGGPGPQPSKGSMPRQRKQREMPPFLQNVRSLVRLLLHTPSPLLGIQLPCP